MLLCMEHYVEKFILFMLFGRALILASMVLEMANHQVVFAGERESYILWGYYTKLYL